MASSGMRAVLVFSLRTTAIGNVIGGLGGLCAPDIVAGALYGRDVSGDPLLLRLHIMFWLFVVALGIGYGLAANRVANGHDELGLLVAGGLGKVAAAALWIEMLARGLALPLVAAAVAFDGSLGVLFLAWAGWSVAARKR